MPEKASRFVWYDLMTTDPAAAAAFYHQVVGWEASEANIPDSPPYTLLSKGEEMICSVMAVPKPGESPCWMGHIGVDDLDAYLEPVQQAGGSIHRAPAAIPGIGRFAVAGDPHGAVFLMFEPKAGASTQADGVGDASQVIAPGRVGWHELQAGEPAEAYGFYSGLFGWTDAGAIDMGPAGMYRMFAIGGAPAGGMMKKMPEAPAPFWQFYFVVDAVQAAVDRATGAGGKLLTGPRQVPGGGWIAQMVDPQGAVFAVTASAP